MKIEPDYTEAAVVLLGEFTPSIFSPQWLSEHGIIGSDAAERAHIELIHPEVAQFDAGEFEFVVQRNRFQVKRKLAPFITISDVTSNLFGSLLPFVPVTAFGINRSMHFSVGSEETRNKIGRLLAPVEPWGKWGQEILQGADSTRGGMVSLSMQQVMPSETVPRKLTATIQPSVLIAHNAGIFVGTNDHYEISNLNRRNGQSVAKLIEECFEAGITKANEILGQLMSLKEFAND